MSREPFLDLQTPAPVPTASPARKLTPRAQALRDAHEAHPEAKLVHVADPAGGVGQVLAFAPDSPWHELLPPWQYATVSTAPLPPIIGHVIVGNQVCGVIRDRTA